MKFRSATALVIITAILGCILYWKSNGALLSRDYSLSLAVDALEDPLYGIPCRRESYADDVGVMENSASFVFVFTAKQPQSTKCQSVKVIVDRETAEVWVSDASKR